MNKMLTILAFTKEPPVVTLPPIGDAKSPAAKLPQFHTEMKVQLKEDWEVFTIIKNLLPT